MAILKFSSNYHFIFRYDHVKSKDFEVPQKPAQPSHSTKDSFGDKFTSLNEQGISADSGIGM